MGVHPDRPSAPSRAPEKDRMTLAIRRGSRSFVTHEMSSWFASQALCREVLAREDGAQVVPHLKGEREVPRP